MKCKSDSQLCASTRNSDPECVLLHALLASATRSSAKIYQAVAATVEQLTGKHHLIRGGYEGYINRPTKATAYIHMCYFDCSYVYGSSRAVQHRGCVPPGLCTELQTHADRQSPRTPYPRLRTPWRQMLVSTLDSFQHTNAEA